MPNETSKPKKGKQGIKDLGNKDGRLLLTALQNGELKIIKADPEKIKKDEVAVIATAEPTTSDASTVHARAIFASGKTWIGNPAPKSTALTRVKRKKPLIIDVMSDDEQDIILPPTVKNDKSHHPPPLKKQSSIKPVYTISSDSEELPPAPAMKQPLSSGPDESTTAKNKPPPSRPVLNAALKKHVPTSMTDSDPDDPSSVKNAQPALKKAQPPPSLPAQPLVMIDSDDPSPVKKRVQPPPLRPLKRQSSKKHVTTIASNAEDNRDPSDSKKRRRLSPPDACEDPVGSGDDYIHEHDDESESGIALTPRTRRTRTAKGKGGNAKGKGKARAQDGNEASIDVSMVRVNSRVNTQAYSATQVNTMKPAKPPASGDTATRPVMVKEPGSPGGGGSHTPSDHSDLVSRQSAPLTDSSLPHLDTSTKIAPPPPKKPTALGSSGWPASTHRAKTAQGLVDAFLSSSRLNRSTVDQPVPADSTEHRPSPPSHEPLDGNNIQSNRVTTPVPRPPFSRSTQVDVTMDEDLYSAQDYDDQYNTDMYGNGDFNMDSAYMNYDVHNAPAHRPLYNLPQHYPRAPPRGHQRYPRRPYPRGAMLYPPPSQGPHRHPSDLRYHPQHGPPRSHGASSAGPSRAPALSNIGPTRNQTFPAYSDQYWYEEEEENVDSHMPMLS